MDRTNEPPPPRPLAAGIVRLVGLWLVVGAAFKLFAGTPNDLPPVVKDFGSTLSLSIGTTYRIAIAAELVLFALALVRPRLAWLPLAGVLVLFDAILVTQLGSDNCGCFGSKISMPPWLMMAIDSVLLLALLATRPWRIPRGGLPLIALPVLTLCGLVLPWMLDREARSPVPGDEGSTEAAGGLRSYEVLAIDEWVGQDLGETPLAKYMDVYSYYPDALWVLWRSTCDHCAEHLAELAQSESGERFLVLLRLHEPHDTEANRAVYLLPEGAFVQHADLPDTRDWVIQTPSELEVEGFQVIRAQEGL